MHATGVGLVLLAAAPPEVQESVLCGPLRSWTVHTITDPARLRSTLADVRRTGVAISDRQVTDDAVSVAVPVRGTRDEVVAALSLVVRHGETPPHTLVPALQTASAGISRALGAPRHVAAGRGAGSRARGGASVQRNG
jgi:DNA-binding IclR family transcriptional regulator